MGIGGAPDTPSQISGQPGREISVKNWAEARCWVEERVNGRKYRLPRNRRPNTVVERGPKRLARRIRQLRTGHCRTGQYLKWTKNAERAELWVVSVQDTNARAPVQNHQALEDASNTCSYCCGRYEMRSGRGNLGLVRSVIYHGRRTVRQPTWTGDENWPEHRIS